MFGSYLLSHIPIYMSSLNDREVLDKASAVFNSLTPGNVVSYSVIDKTRGYRPGEKVVGVILEAPVDGVAKIRKFTKDEIARLAKGESTETVVGAEPNGTAEDMNAREIVGLTIDPPAFLLG